MGEQHQHDEPQPPNDLNDEIPEELNEIMLKVLSKEPSARYRTADQLGRVLLTLGDIDAGNGTEPFSSTKANTTDSKAENGGKKGEIEAIDWLAVGLGLLAALAVGGLLPFWMWVYLAFNPPIR